MRGARCQGSSADFENSIRRLVECDRVPKFANLNSVAVSHHARSRRFPSSRGTPPWPPNYRPRGWSSGVIRVPRSKSRSWTSRHHGTLPVVNPCEAVIRSQRPRSRVDPPPFPSIDPQPLEKTASRCTMVELTSDTLSPPSPLLGWLLFCQSCPYRHKFGPWNRDVVGISA